MLKRKAKRQGFMSGEITRRTLSVVGLPRSLSGAAFRATGRGTLCDDVLYAYSIWYLIILRKFSFQDHKKAISRTIEKG